MPRFRSISMVALAVLPALPLSTQFSRPEPALARHTRQADQGWNLAMTRHFGHPGNASGFSTILLTDGRLWVFGGTNPGGSSSPVAEHFSRGRWTAARLPARLTDFISDASAPSSHDIWAISSYGRYVLRYDGSSWQLARRWRGPGYFSDIVATSARNAWAFGTAANGVRSLGTWHFDGRSWRPAGGNARDIYRASAVNGKDAWAIAAGPRSDAILRFNGRRWHRTRVSRAISSIRWHDILAESARDVWLLGDTTNGRLVFAHWNGMVWDRFVTRLPVLAGQLAGARSGRVLATATSSGLLPTGMVVMMTSEGHLATSVINSSLGCGVSDGVFVARTGAIWASGGTLTTLGGNAAVWERTPGAGSDVDIDRAQ